MRDFFIFLSLFVCFSSFFYATEQRRISMYAYIYLILKDSFGGRGVWKTSVWTEKIIGNFSLNWTRESVKKRGPVEKMENPIFFIVLERWTFSERYTRFEAVKGKKCVWIYAKHRQTINIWTRIPGVGWYEGGRSGEWIDLAYMKEMVRWQFTWKKTADVKNSTILARIFCVKMKNVLCVCVKRVCLDSVTPSASFQKFSPFQHPTFIPHTRATGHITVIIYAFLWYINIKNKLTSTSYYANILEIEWRSYRTKSACNKKRFQLLKARVNFRMIWR